MSTSIPTPPTDETKSALTAPSDGAVAADPEQVRQQLDALSEIYRRSYRVFFRQAMAMVRSPELADDVVQEAVVFTAQTIRRGTVIRELKPWLRVVVRNCARSALSRRRSGSITLAPLDEGLDVADGQGTTDIIDVRDKLDEVDRIVRELPSAQRSAFLLAELRGMEYREIAETMNRTEAAVRQLLCRARNKVRALADSTEDLMPFAAPLKVSVVHCAVSLRDTGRGLRDGVVGRLSDLQQSVSSFFQQSAEFATQPAAALVVGTLVAGSLVLSGAPQGSTPEDAGVPPTVLQPWYGLADGIAGGEGASSREHAARPHHAVPDKVATEAPSPVMPRPIQVETRPVDEIGGGERIRPPAEVEDAGIKKPTEPAEAPPADPSTELPTPPGPEDLPRFQVSTDCSSCPPPPPPPSDDKCDSLSLDTTCDSPPPPDCEEGDGGDPQGGRVMMAEGDGCDQEPPPIDPAVVR